MSNDPLNECRGADGTLDLELVKAWEDRLAADAVLLKGKIEVIDVNLLGLRVCARKDLGKEEIEELTNRLNPAGTRNGWVVDGEIAPVTCSKDAERLHWVLSC